MPAPTVEGAELSQVRVCRCRETASRLRVVDALRALLAGRAVDGDLVPVLAWCLGILLVAHLAAVRVHRSRVG